ncbi:MAG: 16S rRNA (cytosine(1402)-N(4))-methyltransferase, partial [Arenicellales bacterium]
MNSLAHAPVMSAEVVAALHPSDDDILVDATFGRGGHTRALLEKLGPNGRMFV